MATEKLTLQEKLAASKAAAVAEATKEHGKEQEKEKEQKKEEPIEGYKSLRLKQFATANGRMVKPNADGIFIPTTQEEYSMLEYYANQAIAYVERTF